MANNHTEINKKLLDYWEKPSEAGEPIGCLSTTYTFNATHFEEQCLARFMGCSTTPEEDNVLFRVELETRLSQLGAAVAFVDQHKATGARIPRWDVVSTRVPQGILHAKITLLCWKDWMRVIVASANLTPDGFRRNNEVYSSFDFYPEANVPVDILHGTIDFFSKLLEMYVSLPDESRTRIKTFLSRQKDVVRKWKIINTKQNIQYHLGFVWPDEKKSLLSQIGKLWPEATPPSTAWVESPFYDDATSKNWPAEQLWSMMRLRGEAGVHYNVRGRKDVKTGIIELEAPETLSTSKPTRNSVSVYIHLVKEILDGQSRPLHAKTIWLKGERWRIFCIGSSNFTTPGLGLKSKKGAVHIEANVVIVIDAESEKNLYKSLEEAILTESEEVQLDHVKWIPVKDETEQGFSYRSLPGFFSSVVYEMNDKETGQLSFRFDGELDQAWEIVLPSADEKDIKLLHRDEWKSMGSPKKWNLSWTDKSIPSELEIVLGDGRAVLPVFIVSQNVIPLPDLLSGLTLDDIADLLLVKGDFDRMIARLIKKRNSERNKKTYLENDPHKRVNTTAFLIQRTRRVTGALRALRSKLEQPVMTMESLSFRLRGPLGVNALAKAIVKEGRSEEEKWFLLTELLLELSRVRPQEYPGSLDVNIVKQSILEVRRELESQVRENKARLGKSMEQYVATVLLELRQ